MQTNCPYCNKILKYEFADKYCESNIQCHQYAENTAGAFLLTINKKFSFSNEKFPIDNIAIINDKDMLRNKSKQELINLYNKLVTFK